MAELTTYDLCIIGGGAGGIAAAMRARALGASVALIERAALGGNALNAGALPARALTAAARRAHYLTNASAFGIANAEPRINARGVSDHIHGVMEGLAPAVTPEHLLALGIDLIGATARFTDRRTVAAGDRLIRARRFILATGSSPLVPEIPGLDSVAYFTSANIFDNPRKLTHLLVIGGGPVGVELAQAFRRLGAEVTLVDKAQPLAGFDPELAELALRRLAAEGIAIRAATEVSQFQNRSLGIGAVIRSAEGEAALDISHIMVAAGRTAQLDALDLGAAGVARDRQRPDRLALKRGFRTSNARVYAIGDAAGGPQNTHAATYQAEMLIDHLLNRRRMRGDAALVPATVFTDPEIAEVGLREADLAIRRRPYRIVRVSLAENDRARAERQTYGLVKLVLDPDDRLLGAGIVGTGAAEMITLFGFAIANGLSLKHFRRIVPPYPTLGEVVRKLAAEADRHEFEQRDVSIVTRLRRLLRLS